ncbi:hypothetical protein RCS94_09780 [Orbaceae bacterium ac157xtp]
MKKIILVIPLALIALASGGYYYNQQQAPHRPVMQECLGRLTFDVPAGLHWGMASPNVRMWFTARISEGLTTDYDKWNYNRNVLVMVSPETEKVNFDNQWTIYQAGDFRKQEVDKEIEDHKSRIQELIVKQKKINDRLAKGEKMHEGLIITDSWIQRYKDDLKKLEQTRASLDDPVPVHQLSIPDAYTITFDDKWTYAWRQNRVYLFYFTNRSVIKNYNTAIDGVPLSEVEETLQRFTPRQLGEIPKSPAFCYPYGSISDNGKVGYEIKNSFYFEDEPNVIYSIYTGTYRRSPHSNIANQGLREPIINYGKQNKNYEHKDISQTFTLGNGEKITLAGQLSTRKSGVNIGEPYDYVLTGETEGTDPYIGIQIIALDKDPKDGRPNHAPPLKYALKRLEPILNSMKVTLDKPASK